MTTSSESPGRRGPGECPWRATLLCVESTFREPRDVVWGAGVPPLGLCTCCSPAPHCVGGLRGAAPGPAQRPPRRGHSPAHRLRRQPARARPQLCPILLGSRLQTAVRWPVSPPPGGPHWRLAALQPRKPQNHLPGLRSSARALADAVFGVCTRCEPGSGFASTVGVPSVKVLLTARVATGSATGS